MWVARDEVVVWAPGRLYLYHFEPIKSDGYYKKGENCICELPYDILPDVTYENGPVEIELKIKK